MVVAAPVAAATSRVDAPGPHPRSSARRGVVVTVSCRNARDAGSKTSASMRRRSIASGVSPNL
jgi:hypothetical protein